MVLSYSAAPGSVTSLRLVTTHINNLRYRSPNNIGQGRPWAECRGNPNVHRDKNGKILTDKEFREMKKKEKALKERAAAFSAKTQAREKNRQL
jgi:hypothetical protein